ncbi:MAG: hypothetical protein FWG14_04270 [Peptococcaceae bacterium]|nr:hypothetical protein [Peptococcaceae bacterium]
MIFHKDKEERNAHYAKRIPELLGKRLGKGEWQSFSEHFPRTTSDCGFADFDGFNEQDIYLAGLKGDVWHFDGKKAHQIPIPTNIDFTAVCCGGDGEVYLSGGRGKIFRGRDDRWERLENEEPDKDPSTLRLQDLVWYEDKVWATNDYGLWVIENNTIKKADVPDWVRACSGDLSVGDGVILSPLVTPVTEILRDITVCCQWDNVQNLFRSFVLNTGLSDF